ncbi:MAG: DNA polymerase III subunit delta [Gemmatimonadaceae bacterium]|nr:DNA polymerase III subunit delta [Gemmatimonadaceae bacterium]
MAAATHKAFKAALELGEFAPVYVFHGADDYLKEEATRALVARATDPSTRDFNCDLLRGGEIDVAALSSALEALPMLAERRVVVLRDPAAMRKPLTERLKAYLKKPAAETLLVLVVPGGSKVDAWMSADAAALEFKALEGADLAKWIAHEARTHLKSSITAEAAERLATYGGSDLALLAGELRKLAAYSGSETIDAAAVEAITGVRPGVSLGDLLDRAASRDATGAAALVGEVLAQPKQSGVTTVMALTAQMLAIGWGVAARARGLPQHRMESEFFGLLKAGGGVYTGRAWGEAVKCWARAVPKWSLEEVARAMPHLHAADAALKDSKVSSEEQIVTSLLLAIVPAASRRRAA